MKSLEQDALKAQMVIAKSRDGKKRGTMDQLTESPSPAPTPSPTPMEGRRAPWRRVCSDEAEVLTPRLVLLPQSSALEA